MFKNSKKDYNDFETNGGSSPPKKNKHKKRFLRVLWTLSMLTWSLISNVINTIILIVFLMIYGREIKETYWYKGRLIILVDTKDSYFGGLECGWCILLGEKSSLKHELGHTIQCALWGPLYWFVIGLPSTIRYQYYNYLYKHKIEEYYKLKPYSSIWFENQATEWGHKYFN